MGKKIKKRSLKEEYKEIFSFIQESKNYIYSVIGILFFFALFSFFTEFPEDVKQQIFNLLKEIIEKFEGKNVYETIFFIFANNTWVSLMALVFGIFFGIFPILAMVSNGIILGFVAKQAILTEGIFVLLRLLPHGIFELPAIFISAGLGVKWGFEVFKKDKFRENLKKSFKTFFLLVVPLLIVAAIIEGVLIFLTV